RAAISWKLSVRLDAANTVTVCAEAQPTKSAATTTARCTAPRFPTGRELRVAAGSVTIIAASRSRVNRRADCCSGRAQPSPALASLYKTDRWRHSRRGRALADRRKDSPPPTSRGAHDATSGLPAITEIDTPAVIIDLDRAEANITKLQTYLDSHGI